MDADAKTPTVTRPQDLLAAAEEPVERRYTLAEINKHKDDAQWLKQNPGAAQQLERAKSAADVVRQGIERKYATLGKNPKHNQLAFPKTFELGLTPGSIRDCCTGR